MLSKIKDYVTLEQAIKECTPRGNGKSIKTNKPKSGIYAYVWRMARFESGDDRTMPMMAIYDLYNGIHDAFGVSHYRRDADNNLMPNYAEKEITDFLDDIAKQVVERAGLGPLELVVTCDGMLAVTGNQNSLNAIAVSGIVDKVNKINNKLDLAIIYHGAKHAGYSDVDKAWDIIKDGIKLDKLEEINIGDLRQAIVRLNGGSINGAVDRWIDGYNQRKAVL